jgi:hypothetical protein
MTTLPDANWDASSPKRLVRNEEMTAKNVAEWTSAQ